MSALRRHRPLGVALFAVTVLYAAWTLGSIPQSFAAMTRPTQKTSVWQLINAIPANAAVAATYDFLAPLSSRENLVSFNYVFLGSQQFLQKKYALPTSTEYLLIDFKDLVTYQLQYGFSPFYKTRYDERLGLWPSTLNGFSVIAASDTTALFQRYATSSIVLAATLKTLPADIEQPSNLAVSSNLTYLGARRTSDHVELFWRATSPLTTPYRLKLQRADSAVYLPFAYDLLIGSAVANASYIQTNIWHVPDGMFEFSVVTINSGGIDVDGSRGTVATVDDEQVLTPTITVR